MQEELTAIEKEFNELFDKLVPERGKCESRAGELLRAVSRIRFRNWNDGDHIGVGYGNETCNASARYLQKYGSDKIQSLVTDMWGLKSEDLYDLAVDRLVELAVEQVNSDPALQTTETEDMFDLYEKSDEDWMDEDNDAEDYDW